MIIIAFLIMIINFNLFAVEIPQFKNKIAISGSSFYTIDKNGNINIINFTYYDFEEGVYKLFEKPNTNTFFFDKINPYNTNELHYYSIYKEDDEVSTNYRPYIIEKEMLLLGIADTEYGGFDYDDPYDYNDLSAVGIFVDYDKYGKKYIENLMNKDLNRYKARYFEGKYVAEDGKSYLKLKREYNNTFSVEGKTPNYSINVIGNSDENTKVQLYPEKREIDISFINGNEYISIQLNILDNDTLIVFEQSTDKVLGFKGIYTKVKE